MRLRLVISAAALLLVLGCGAYEKMDAEYQKDADEQRVKHFYQIAELIEEYKDKAGHYPLANQRESLKKEDGTFKDEDTKKFYESNPEVECLVTPREIPDHIKNRPGSYMRVSYDFLNSELSKVLGREILLPYDPQEVPVYKPNFYVYLNRGGDYYLAVHLYEPHAHSKKISEHFYKLEVTSVIKHPNGIVNYREMRAESGKAAQE